MEPVSKNNFHGGNITRAARKYGFSEKDLLDFSASINPLGPAPGVYSAITEGMWRIKHYPDPDCGDLPELLADHLGVDRKNIVLGNGGAELIYILPAVLKIKRAIVFSPTFSEYAEAVEACGGEVIHAGFSVDPERVKEYLPWADALYICNPNNPTGQAYSRAALEPLFNAAEQAGTMVVVDEAFMDFVEGRKEKSVMEYACTRPWLVVLYSMTKFFGLPGLRLGAAVAAPEIIAQLKRARDPWSVNTLAVLAGEAALRDRSHMEETGRVIREEREYLLSYISAIPGLKPFQSEANFLLVDISGTGMMTDSLVDELGRKGILVRNCSNFYMLDLPCIRVAVRGRPDNEKLVRALMNIFP